MFGTALALATSPAALTVGRLIARPLGAVLAVGLVLGGVYGLGVHEGREPGRIAAAESAAAAARADLDAATHAKADADARAAGLDAANATALAKVADYEARLSHAPACALTPADAGGVRSIADAPGPNAPAGALDHGTDPAPGRSTGHGRARKPR